MKQQIVRHFYAFISLLVGFAVLLSGVHAKDLPALSQADKRLLALGASESRKVAVEDGSSVTSNNFKAASEFHNHIDKQTLKSLLDNGVYTDPRGRNKSDDKDVFDEVRVHWLQEQLLMFQVAYSAVRI